MRPLRTYRNYIILIQTAIIMIDRFLQALRVQAVKPVFSGRYGIN